MSKIIQGNEKLFKKKLAIDKKGISFDDYGAKPLVEIDPEDTMYNTFRKAALKRKNKICVIHNNIEYTYEQILNMVDRFSASLDLRGIKKGDCISLPLDHSLEATVALLAINKIGAVSKWIDVEKSYMELLENFESTNSKFIIANKDIEEKINKVVDNSEYGFDSILILDIKNHDDAFYSFLEEGINHNALAVEYDENMPAIMITSSGSTGKPKNMIHSSYSVNNAVKKLTYTDYPIKDNIMLIGIPPYIGLGLITTLYASLICGGEALILPQNKSPLAFTEYILENIESLKALPKNKKVLLFAAPVFFKSMFSSLDSIDDLSFIGAMVAAGNKMDEETLLAIDEKFKSKGCTVPVCNAYGQNEHCGGISYNTIKVNKRGSAGKVAYGTRVMVVDSLTGEELPKNKIGKIVEQSNSQFLGYFNNPEAEKKCVFVDKDGEVWFDTEDLGSFDDDNFLHVFDREGRSIIRFDFKVALASIENKLRRHPNISDAIVVKVIVDTPFGKEPAPYAFVVIKNPDDKIDGASIMSDIQSGDYPFSMIETPINIEVIKEDQIPYKNNKVDYMKLEKVAQQIVNSVPSEQQINKEKVKNKK